MLNPLAHVSKPPTVVIPPHPLDQDEEFCEVVLEEGERRRIRFHDYAEIYAVPGLYERLFSEMLECRSPQIVAELLADRDVEEMCVLDFGAGNGLVGEALRGIGVGSVVACNLLPEARDAALRDRPGVYDDYVACDITAPDPDCAAVLDAYEFTGMTCVAALGFGDVPPTAFAAAYDRVAEGGAVAFNIKEDFLEDDEGPGFGRLIGQMLDAGVLEEHARKRYVHRLATDERPLHYLAIDATKRGSVPAAWLA